MRRPHLAAAAPLSLATLPAFADSHEDEIPATLQRRGRCRVGLHGQRPIGRGAHTGPGPGFAITLGAVLGTARLISAVGSSVRVNRESFLDKDRALSGLISNRIVVQAADGDVHMMVEHLERMDFRELMMFGM